MIEVITKKSLLNTRKEIWFKDYSNSIELVDNNLFYQSFSPPPHNAINQQEFLTLISNLEKTEEELFSKINSDFRNKIRRGVRLNLRASFNSSPDDKFIDDYIRSVNIFFQSRNMSLIDLNRLNGLLNSNCVSFAQVFQEDKLIVTHCYVHDDKRVRLLTSNHSIEIEDGMLRGNANKFLHWEAMRYFKQIGFCTYDWGGIDKNSGNQIARFKLKFGGTEDKNYNYEIKKGVIYGIYGMLKK